MKQLTFDQFLYDFSWSDNVRHKLRVTADRDDVRYLVAWDNAGQVSASVFTSKPKEWPETALAVWAKRGDLESGAKSKTMMALDLVLDSNMTVYAAAKALGINQSAIHRAIKRREDKDICPQCNQVIRNQSA